MFYDIFSNLCQKRGIKPSRAAEECGINKSNVSNWKNNGYIPRGEALGKLATYFGVSVDYLLGNEQKEKAPSQNEKKPEDITFDDFSYALLDETKELTKENKDKLLEMAKFFKQQQDKENHNSQD
jgi:transcriptional regulator with XRE-family HTH domain